MTKNAHTSIDYVCIQRGEIRWCQFARPHKRRLVLMLTRESAIEFLEETILLRSRARSAHCHSKLLSAPAEPVLPQPGACRSTNPHALASFRIRCGARPQAS